MTTDKLVLGLIFLVIATDIVAVVAINLHADTETKCLNYKDVLPNGVCINELKNYKIYQSPIIAKLINKERQLEKIFLTFLKDKTRKEFLLYMDRTFRAFGARYHNCFKVPSFRKLFLDVRRFASNISLQCINSIRRIYCHRMHPVCFKSEEDGRIILSPPCEKNYLSGCEYNIEKRMNNLELTAHKLCPNHIQYPSKDVAVYSRARPPMADMKHIERCQNIVEPKEEHVSGTCYIDDGTFYNGTVSITTTGKTCLPWNINPFLSSPVYDNLKNNYCRNPQAYAAAPWCYVAASNRDWEFCDVPKCGESNKENTKNVNSASIEIEVVIVVYGLVFTFILVLSIWKIYSVRREKKYGDEYIDPYYVSETSDEEKRSQLLSLLIKNEH